MLQRILSEINNIILKLNQCIISQISAIHLWLFAFLQSVNDKKRRGPNDKKGGGPFCNHVNTQKYQHIKLLLNQKKSY